MYSFKGEDAEIVLRWEKLVDTRGYHLKTCISCGINRKCGEYKQIQLKLEEAAKKVQEVVKRKKS